MREQFRVPGEWLDNPIRVTVVGAGGTGGEVLDGLARMDAALRAVGHPHGFEVTVFDPDTVSQSNVGRQRFSPADVGVSKAILLVHRFNLFYGLSWRARPVVYNPEETPPHQADLLVTCVDKATVRVAIGEHGHDTRSNRLWLDFGNGSHTGQVVLGHWSGRVGGDVPLRLPNVFDLYQGELRAVDDTEEPSCSAEEAFRRQDFGVNRLVADVGLGLLWNLLRHGETSHHGGYINVRSGSVSPLLIDRDSWRFLGYDPAAAPQEPEDDDV